jgi:hypothetical protein
MVQLPKSSKTDPGDVKQQQNGSFSLKMSLGRYSSLCFSFYPHLKLTITRFTVKVYKYN